MSILGKRYQVIDPSCQARPKNRKIKNTDFVFLIEMESFDYALYGELGCESQGSPSCDETNDN